MDLEVKGVSPCPGEPTPRAQGSGGGCQQQQQQQQQDGQAGERGGGDCAPPPPPPEKRQSSEKEDKKIHVYRHTNWNIFQNDFKTTTAA
ncbi:hypothetical protein JRQ81_018789 [Phrynocephalus forsythii]|uniref:Uncharacterized protein n=1 Tax=Phrynocephalus forsythii TaxID=171643 RepID=A0A9Q1AZY7_9SAUR|nr:hypothetical protein JRQ81_018789 [Phrynocephalus forsythii]